MALKNMPPEMQQMDKVVKALNSKIQKIAETFGTSSRQYRQIEEILTGYDSSGRQRNRFSILSVGGIREKDGVIQLSRSRKALAELEISSYNKALQRVAKLPSAASTTRKIAKAHEAEQLRKMEQAYKEAHGGAEPSARERRKMERQVKLSKSDAAALAKETVAEDVRIGDRLEQALAKLYQMQEEQGVEFSAITEIRKLSRGQWTRHEDLIQMLNIAEKAAETEDREIQGDLYAGY